MTGDVNFSPLEIHVLLNSYALAAYKCTGPEGQDWSTLSTRLVRIGLVEWVEDRNRGLVLRATEMGKALVERILSTPVPVRRVVWDFDGGNGHIPDDGEG